jgi:hypothetical protein
MGAAMYGETAAGYGRPPLLAFGRPRPNYVQKIRPAAASANMSRIKCHALVNMEVSCSLQTANCSLRHSGNRTIGSKGDTMT